VRKLSGDTKIGILIVVAVLALSLIGIDKPTNLTLLGAIKDIGGFVAEMFPPDTSRNTVTTLAYSALVTLEISIIGTVISAAVAVPLAVLSSRRIMDTDKRGERLIVSGTRSLMNGTRAIPTLVWAIIFVAALGLGPLAGVIALAVHNSGVLGKLYSEFMDSVDQVPLESMRAVGLTKTQLVFYGVLPQALPEMVSYTLYRWECSIRVATVLGVVGAGGIGFYVILSVKMLQFDQLLTAILFILGLVTAGDVVSVRIRERII